MRAEWRRSLSSWSGPSCVLGGGWLPFGTARIVKGQEIIYIRVRAKEEREEEDSNAEHGA